MKNDIELSSDTQDLLLLLSDELAPARREALESRLATDPELQAQLDSLTDLDAMLKSDGECVAASAFRSEHALNATLRLVREQSVLMGQPREQLARRFQMPRYAVAAGIAIVFTLGLAAWIYNAPQPQMTDIASSGSNLPSGVSSDRGQNDGTPGGMSYGPGIASAFSPIGVEQYSESSRSIDMEIDALSMLAEYNADEE